MTCGLLLTLAVLSTALAILPMSAIANTRFSSLLQEAGLR
jgi:hypothetical protein